MKLLILIREGELTSVNLDIDLVFARAEQNGLVTVIKLDIFVK